MKPHIILTLRPEVMAPPAPYWVDAVADRRGTETPPTTAVARALADAGVTALTTAEYAPAEGARGWSPDERAAGLDRTYRLVLTDGRPVPVSLIHALHALPDVADARAGLITASPLPPMRSLSAGSGGGRYALPQQLVRLADAHRMTRGLPQITVAILDTGVDTTHPEFAGRIVRPMDFVDILDGAGEFIGDFLGTDAEPDDDVGHGTHVAAIAAGAGAAMPTGVAPRCRIMPVRVLGAISAGDGRVGAGLIDNINAGVKYAVDNGADVINMSLGVERAGSGLPHEQVIRYANAKGVVVVAASGNDGRENLYYPGALPGVIAVGATADDGGVSEFSTFGPHVTMTAPGEDIVSAQPDNGYAAATGTSHAAPFVAGTAALMQSLARAKGGTLSPRQIRRALRASSDRIGSTYRDRRAGFGRLNCLDALRAAQLELA